MEQKLKKIVNLAKFGIGGEKEVAERMVRRICERQNLDFEEVMRGEPEMIDCKIKFRGKAEKELAINVIAKFGLLSLDDASANSYGGAIHWKTTKEKYVDTINAWDMLRRQMRVEIARIPRAMIIKHELFYAPTKEELEKLRKLKKEKTQEELERERAAASLACGLEDVEIFKRIK